MRIYYLELGNTGGVGGGAGQIVPKQKIQVTPGDILTITVGEGGTGGTAGIITNDGTQTNSTAGTGANASIISKITNSDGIILVTTAPVIATSGAQGGGADGTSGGTAGLISSGVNMTPITYEGFSNTSGANANEKEGGLGGLTVLENSQVHCSPGSGGTSGNAGGDATGYGGCGGGGGGAGANGGKGAGGYVKITYGT